MFVVTGGLIRALSVQRGLLVLRETALERDGEAILLLGHSDADKSTRPGIYWKKGSTY